jgi:ketosteroid isomerase-like protein
MMSENRQSARLSPPNIAAMSELSRTIVQHAWQAFASHDADQISAVFTEDAEWLAPPGNATAIALDTPSGHLVGRKAIVRFLAEDFSRVFARDVTVTFHGFHADGTRVVVEETMTATLANGNHYANDYCFIFELQDGLIHRVREYMDTARAHRMMFGEVPQ